MYLLMKGSDCAYLMAAATSCTTYIGIVVLPEEASSAYVRVVIRFASKNPCTHVSFVQEDVQMRIAVPPCFSA